MAKPTTNQSTVPSQNRTDGSSTILNQMKRPLPLILFAIAVLGWLTVVGLLFSRNELRADMESRLQAEQAQRLAVEDELEMQVSTSGMLQDVQDSLELAQSDLVKVEEQKEQTLLELQSGQQELADVTQQTEEVTARLETVKTEIAPIDERLTNQVQLIDDAEKNVVARTEELATVGERLDQARTQEADLRAGVSQLSAEASDLAKQASEAETMLQSVRDAEASLQQELKTAREELTLITDQHAGLQEAVAQLTSRRQQLAEDTTAAQTQRAAMQEELTSLTQRMSTRADELAKLEARIEELHQQGAQTSDAQIVGLQPGSYSADGVEATIESDGNFSMTPEGKEQMNGQFAVDGNSLTLSGVETAPEGFVFPMTCEISFEPTGFSLATPEQSGDDCTALNGKSFSRK